MDFLYSVLEYVYKCELLPYGSSLISFRATRLEGLTMGTANVYTVALLALPVIVAICGTVILVRRKNR